jgi:adenylate cyclase
MRVRRFYRVALIAAAVLIAAAGVASYGFDLLENEELDSVDTRFSIRGDRDAPEEIVFVEIDDSTFNVLKSQFPLPRIHHANVINNLAADGAKAIAYDVQFTEPGPDPKQDNALVLSVRRAGNVVLATTEVAEDGSTRIFGGGAGLEFSRGVPSESGYPNDPEGVIRRMDFDVAGLDSFPIASAQTYLGREVDKPDGDTAWIDYPGGPGTIESIPFWRVESGEFDPGMFEGKIAVVGASAVSLQDLHPTSTTGDDPMPGPEIHASAMDTILNGFPLDEAPGWTAVLAILFFGLLPPLLALRWSALRAVLVTAVALLLYLVMAQFLFNGGTILVVVYPALAALLSSIAAMVLYGLTTAFERERARDAFARFVPESVVGEVLDQADGVRLGGVRKEGTVLFSDLRGFTSFAEHREPDEVIDILNRYLTAMSDSILDHGGTLVAYMGDGIMAVFGAPVDQDDHADRALAAGKDMLVRMEDFNDWLKQEWDADGFKMGVGLNTGPVMSGNVGSERRLEYTAIGDTTNTAARLEGMTKGTPYQLYFAESTKAALVREPPEDPEQVGDFEVRGRKDKISLWTLPSTQLE